MQKIRQLHWGQSLLVALVGALLPIVIVPVQTCVANAPLFNFGVSSVLAESVPVAVGVFLLLWAVLTVSELLTGRLLHVLVLTLSLCVYFEVGVFSMGLPPLNGDTWPFDNPFRKLIDAGLWGLVILVCFACYKFLKNNLQWVALALLVMSVASVFDARTMVENTSSSPLAAGYCPRYDVLKSIRFSPKRNVIVLVIDSCPGTVAARVMREEPQLQEAFPGFVAYENNIAMHEMTVRGIPGLMTGRYLEPDVTSDAYLATIFGENSLLLPYAQANDAVFFSEGLQLPGYTNRRAGDFSKIDSGLIKDGAVFARSSLSTPYISLYEIVKFRLVPYVLKFRYLSRAMYAASKRQTGVNPSLERNAYSIMKENPLSTDGSQSLVVVHTLGVHGPILFDRHNKRLPAPSQKPKDLYEYSVYKFGEIADLMKHLQKIGVYDKSLIIIAADHGNYVEPAVSPDRHTEDNSILWIKPEGAADPFRFSKLPTSNCRIAPLVKAAQSKPLSAAEIDKLVEAHDRIFRAKHGTTWYSFGKRLFFYEWQYDDDGRVVRCENLGIFKAN